MLTSCKNPSEQKTQVTPVIVPISITHNIDQCPDITGKYFRESGQGEDKEVQTLSVSLEESEGTLFFSDGRKTIIVDGQTHNNKTESEKDTTLDYQAGCDNQTLVFQQSFASSLLAQTSYSVENGMLNIRSKSLNESILRFSELDSIWIPKTSDE